jgi:hypothetical protein
VTKADVPSSINKHQARLAVAVEAGDAARKSKITQKHKSPVAVTKQTSASRLWRGLRQSLPL